MAKRNSDTAAAAFEDVCEHAHGMSGSVRELGDAVKDMLIDKFGDMLKRAVALSDRGSARRPTTREGVATRVQSRILAKPVRSVLLAAGVGIVVGLVLRRR